MSRVLVKECARYLLVKYYLIYILIEKKVKVGTVV